MDISAAGGMRIIPSEDGFNLNMFQSPGEGTPTRDPNICAVEESTIVKEAIREDRKSVV